MKTCPSTLLSHPAARRFAITLCSLAAATSFGQAAPVLYTSSYSASTLPNATAGTSADPLWYFTSPTGTYSASIVNGALNASTVGVGSTQWWALGTASGSTWSGSTPGVWNTSTATVDFRLQVLSGEGGNTATGNGFMLQLSDSANRFYTFYAGPTAFTFQNGASTSLSVTSSSLGIDTSLYHTYRVAMSGGVASLYIDGLENPIFSTVSGITLGSTVRTSILFGDGSSAMSGSYNLDYINWSNTTSEFSAPIPEPAMITLLGVAGLVLVLRRRR